MKTACYSRRNINVEEIYFPEAIINNQIVDDSVEKILSGKSLEPLKITEGKQDQLDYIYQLASPITLRDILSLAVAKRVRELRPNKYSYVLCHVM